MYVCVSVYNISVVPLEVRGGIGSLNRALPMVVAAMWVQGIEPGSSGKATSALNAKSSLPPVSPSRKYLGHNVLRTEALLCSVKRLGGYEYN